MFVAFDVAVLFYWTVEGSGGDAARLAIVDGAIPDVNTD